MGSGIHLFYIFCSKKDAFNAQNVNLSKFLLRLHMQSCDNQRQMVFLPSKQILTDNWSKSMSRIEEVKNLMTELEEDMEKFYDKGNKAAGTRARKQLQDLKKLSQEIRIEIQDIKNAD